ncbi:ubiquitin carboxyl-terminal hydrolase 10, partial [Harmonia axyridis]|uniref:ubiquitin carboxyl-terminal hydrolase 10 n=1 Tax=Harmonia axyridis TaxID=115357 RepID=UPI001E278B00
KNYKIDGTQISFKPRGLRNRSNFCYINSILQALLACPPLCNLLKRLSENFTHNNALKSITMSENMCKFMNNFDNLPNVRRKSRSKKKNKKQTFVNIDNGNSFEASSFYTMLNGTRSDSFLVEGRQEDAEEFLGLLLNGLNDEMMGKMKLISHDENIQAAKIEGNVTREIQMDKTPISDIFGGLLCSRIHKTGDETSENIEPFLTLPLNIKKANNIAEALEGLTTKNKLEGLTSSKTKEPVEAWQQVMIEKLPVVLVLHLKCFEYRMNGCTKIMKTIEFPINLQIDSKILSGRTNTPAERKYKLISVVYHVGKEASYGHYIADTFHSGYNTWLRFDDSKINRVTEEDVLKRQGDRVPYLLFYRRSDTV